MFKRTILSALILATGLISAQANAAFVETDWKEQGDRLATLDTETGIEWLDLTQTLDKSTRQVVDLLDSTYKGWRLPSVSEYRQMVFNLYGYDAVGKVLTMEQRSTWQSLFGFWGDGTYKTSAGWLSVGTENGNVVQAGLRTISLHLHYYTYTSNEHYSSQVDYLGVYLVSDGGTTLSSINNPRLNINNPNAPVSKVPETPADVPVHAGFGLLGLVLMAFGLRRRVKGV